MKSIQALHIFVGVLLTMLASASLVEAQNPPRNSLASQNKSGAHLRLVVILSRHGVRPPTWTQERLNAYSALPWPMWSVPPGYLTPHGFELLKRFGSFDREFYSASGLFPASGCPATDGTHVWADTDQRTMESARALAEGLFPGCPPAVHSLAAGERDPLFHPGSGRSQAEDGPSKKISLVTAPASQNGSQGDELIAEMQHVLMGCLPEADCRPEHSPAIPLLGAPATVDARDPMGLAASFAEDFLLEYVEGMPDDQVGWGKVDEHQLIKFLELHSRNSDLAHRTPERARLEASNLLFHITRTLEQGVEKRTVEDAVGPVDGKMVLLVGHDTNIEGVAGLLGLHWTLDGRKDDTPPGTELAFQLWQSERGAYTVRVTVAMQTLTQMRELHELTLAAPPANQVVTLTGCGTDADSCRWNDFLRTADAVVDRNSVFTEQPN